MSDQIVRATGLLVIEVVNSNPNGDPDRESDPRQRPDDRGEISPVSYKRKLRDLVENKEGPVWCEVGSRLKAEEFEILESRGRERDKIRKLSEEEFKQKYWDGRLFGNTFLEEGASTSIKTGVAQFGLAVSIAPIRIERMTNTNKAGVQADKDRGMAPLGYRIVQHGVYCMPFFVNPTAASKSGCTKRDIDLMLKLIPYAYPHTASYVRPFVGLRHAWYIEHKSPLGSCSDFALISALTPKKTSDPESPSISWEDYSAATTLPDELKKRIGSIRDLMGA
ncbi:MAG TPA: type I CRISPR-associated protein Cas7 [Tepidisphaeraceae bacterium]|jgi:Cas7 group CRISPR-associated protein Csh2